MKKRVKCPRCHGPAEMIDKAPPGESGDVIRCAREAACVEESRLAKDLELAHSAVADAALEFYRQVGKLAFPPPVEVKLPGYVVADLLNVVREWKDAGEALVVAQRSPEAFCDPPSAKRMIDPDKIRVGNITFHSTMDPESVDVRVCGERWGMLLWHRGIPRVDVPAVVGGIRADVMTHLALRAQKMSAR